MQKNNEYDIIFVGGGISSLAIAYGLCKKDEKLKIAIFDSPTEVNKASRTNVGLIWCQSKFLHKPEYAKWGFISANLFPKVLKDVQEVSGVHVPVNFTGGLIPVLGEEEYNKRGSYIEELKVALGGYPGSMLSRGELEQKLPKIKFGDAVTGAAWCEEDGFVEPLLLMRSYRKALLNLGVAFHEDTIVYDTKCISKNEYSITTSKGEFSAERIVLAAGLANKRFAQFSLNELATPRALPIFADKGQVLLTERMPFVMPIPVLGATQTFGGTVIIGFKHETRGHDATVIPSAVSQEGAWAVRVWPELGKKRVIRSWPGLRIMPDDNMAIYSRLPNHPNAIVINTHSAVTMSAVHTTYLPEYIMGGELPTIAQDMTLKRFGFDC